MKEVHRPCTIPGHISEQKMIRSCYLTLHSIPYTEVYLYDAIGTQHERDVHQVCGCYCYSVTAVYFLHDLETDTFWKIPTIHAEDWTTLHGQYGHRHYSKVPLQV